MTGTCIGPVAAGVANSGLCCTFGEAREGVTCSAFTVSCFARGGVTGSAFTSTVSCFARGGVAGGPVMTVVPESAEWPVERVGTETDGGCL